MQERFRTRPPLTLDETILEFMRKKREGQKLTFLHRNERLHQFSRFMESVKIILVSKHQLAM